MKISKTSQILTALFSLACAIAAGYLILRGSGMFPEPSISLILLTAIFIILLSSSRKSFYFILLPLVCHSLTISTLESIVSFNGAAIGKL
jgi:glucan phosphoethanolaminetransferase (alkaline phosphatase superfamily)